MSSNFCISDHPTGQANLWTTVFVAFERILFAGQWFQIYYKGLLFRIFRILSTQYDFSLSKEQKQTMNWIVFEEISDYIRAHFRDITIQDLVDEFHYQEDYFNRLIKRKTGLTYSAYVQQIRLERAEHLLVSTDKSIEEIADSVGYHNKGYFYKLFQENTKRHLQVTDVIQDNARNTMKKHSNAESAIRTHQLESVPVW